MSMMMRKKDKYSYEDFSEWKWRSFGTGKSLELDEWIEQKREDHVFMIGTDSRNKSKCSFTTAISAYKLGRGGSALIHKAHTPKVPDLRQRLLLETMMSLETAWYLSTKIPSLKNVIVIHLDINQSVRWESGKYHDELVGFVTSQGFEALSKPNAWAATCVADLVCKRG